MSKAYIKLSTLEYPRHPGDIALEHPEVILEPGLEKFVCPDTYAEVQHSEIPAYDADIQKVQELAPIQVDGVWTQQWEVVALTELEIKINAFVKEKGYYPPPNSPIFKTGSIPNVIG